MLAWDAGDCRRNGVLDGYDHTNIALDALDDPRHTGKGTISDLHPQSRPAGKIKVVKIDWEDFQC